MKPEDLPTASFHDERIDMWYWFPQLMKTDIPRPDTVFIPIENIRDKTDEIASIVENLGGEAFVRSGYKSAQLALSEGSIIRSTDEEHIDLTIAELLSQHAMMQIPTGDKLWIRELLDVDFCAYCRGNVVPECRVFVRDGEVICHHPRLDRDFDRAPDDHREMAIEYIESGWDGEHRDETIQEYAAQAANTFDGSWSIDFIMDHYGQWYCTDMAIDALYDQSEPHGELGWSNISEHPGDCEHDLEAKLDDEYLAE